MAAERGYSSSTCMTGTFGPSTRPPWERVPPAPAASRRLDTRHPGVGMTARPFLCRVVMTPWSLRQLPAALKKLGKSLGQQCDELGSLCWGEGRDPQRGQGELG